MKSVRFIMVLLIVALVVIASGCGAASVPGPPAEIPEPVTINYLDGGEGIPVDSTFKYVFSRPVKVSTVNASTFFMVKHEPPIPDPICDPSYAIDATVESLSDTEFVLTPAEPLEYSTTYTICLTQEIQYATGEQFEGVTATFTTEVEGPLSLNTLDGAVDIPVDSTFRYRFLREVDASTVNDSTYFIVPVQPSASINKAALDPAICNPVNAIDSEISCTQWSCTIAPTEILDYLYNYTACLTSDISYQPVDQSLEQFEIQSQASFGGFMAGFTTAQWIISSIKLVRLDGTELDLSDRPIPRMVHIRYTFSSAADRAAFEQAVNLIDEDGVPVDGSYEWASDDLSTTFVPAHRFEYRSEYTIDIDTGLLPRMSISKALENQELSFTTMTAKDTNGDGFGDTILGARAYIGGDYTGRAYYFLGSASGIADCDLRPPSTCTPDAITTGAHIQDWVGWCPQVLGDVNADGFADVLVDASGAVDGDWRGAVYVFLGSASGAHICDLADPACTPDTTITGKSAGDGLGDEARAAGDVNGDGYDDLIVGAPLFDASSSRGEAYVFYGSVSGIDSCDMFNGCVPPTTITGAHDDDLLGTPVSSAGDVNDDGYDDIIVGAFGYEAGTMQGRAYVLLGSEAGVKDCDLSATQPCTPHATITGKKNGEWLGLGLSTAGDINADGYDDIIVGAMGYDNGSDRGQAYILLGSASGIGNCDMSDGCIPDATITGKADGDALGYNVSTIGDVNADGYDDFAASAPWYSTTNNLGQTYVFLGSASGIGDCDMGSGCTPHATITGQFDGELLGRLVSSGVDVDGDGYDDFITNGAFYEEGRSYLFLGSESGINDCDLGGECMADTTFIGENIGDWFGSVR